MKQWAVYQTKGGRFTARVWRDNGEGFWVGAGGETTEESRARAIRLAGKYNEDVDAKRAERRASRLARRTA